MVGAFQYGYTIAIMAGALLLLAPRYELDPSSQGFLVSAILFGALFGAVMAGMIADFLGRKKAQILIAAFFLIGTLVVVFSNSYESIIIGRVLQGLATGAISVIGPMYVAEVAPASLRGRYVSFYQLTLTFGIVCAYFTSYLFSGDGGFRWMFAIGIVPAIAQGIGFLFLPDSHAVQNAEKASWRTVFKKEYRPLLNIAVLVNFFQQLTGINAIIYFAPSIFTMCGFKSVSGAIFSAVLIGLVNFLSTIISIFLVDRKGRKPLLLVGLVGMFLSLVILSLSCSVSPWIAMTSLMFYVGFFAFGLGPIPQLLSSEIFPHSLRSRGMSVALLVSWICNFLVVFTFMDLVRYLTQAGAFLIYAVFALAALFIIWKKIPETKGTILK